MSDDELRPGGPDWPLLCLIVVLLGTAVFFGYFFWSIPGSKGKIFAEESGQMRSVPREGQ